MGQNYFSQAEEATNKIAPGLAKLINITKFLGNTNVTDFVINFRRF